MSSKNRKKQGSVLLTVVFVMSILIVFLFGTIALAMAANSRAHVNYSSAQTGITARSVAESAIKAIGNGTPEGKAYAKAIGKMDASSSPISVGVDISGSNASSLGHVEDVQISYAGTKKYYDVTKEEWLQRDVLKFTSTVNMSGVKSSSSIYVIKHFEEDNEGKGKGGAGFVTTSGANLSTQTNVFGGTYVSLPTLDDAMTYEYEDYHIDRYKRLEDGTLVPFGDASNTANAFFTQNSGAIIEADCFVNNNMYFNNWSGLIFPEAGTGLTIMGDACFNDNARDHFSYVYNGQRDNLEFNKVPYVYVDGKIFGAGGLVKLGNNGGGEQSFPLNVFCGSIDVTNETSVMNCNLYCMDNDMTSKLLPTNPYGKSNLYLWTESVVTQAKTTSDKNVINGEFCTNGNLIVKNFEFGSDLRVNGNLDVQGSVKVHGNVVVGGTITGIENLQLDDGKNIYNDIPRTETETVTIEYENQVGYFSEYTVMDVDPDWGNYSKAPVYWGPNKQPINIPGIFNNGVYAKEENASMTFPVETENGGKVYWLPDDPKGMKIYYTTTQDCSEDVAEKDRVNYIDYNIPPVSQYDTDNLKFAEGHPLGFYVKTDIVPESIVKNEDGTYSYDTVVNNYVKTRDKTSSYTFDEEHILESHTTQEYLNMIGETTVYPEYARRRVIVGKDTIDGVDKENTKIVKTVEEVLDGVSNPYEAAELPADVKTTYNKLESDNTVCDSTQRLLEFNDNTAVASMNDDGSYTIGTPAGAMSAASSGVVGYYISKSCILNNISIGTGDGNKLVINPGSSNLLLVIKGTVSIASGIDVVIDDSQGGNVYFYIDDNSTLSFAGNNVLTKTYKKAISENSKFKFESKDTAENAGYQDISDLNDPCPNVFVNGAKDSNLNISNASIVTMNIISPYLKVTAGGGTGNAFTNFEYHDVDLFTFKNYNGESIKTNNFIIGCLNAKEVSSSNQINVIYVPDDGGASGSGSAGDDEFWYKPLYYSEY